DRGDHADQRRPRPGRGVRPGRERVRREGLGTVDRIDHHDQHVDPGRGDRTDGARPLQAELSREMTSGAERFRALHHGGTPLILPNAWDPVSAKIMAEAGFPSVATSSGAVARVLGYDDGQLTPPADMFTAVAQIARAVDVPVTADLEAGYGLAPKEFVE